MWQGGWRQPWLQEILSVNSSTVIENNLWPRCKSACQVGFLGVRGGGDLDLMNTGGPFNHPRWVRALLLFESFKQVLTTEKCNENGKSKSPI